MQTPVTRFASQCGKASIFVENDMPIGVFHDFLMHIKGLMVDRMVAAHQEQVTQAANAMAEMPQDGQCCDPAPADNQPGEVKGEV